MLNELITSLRIGVVSILVCVIGYGAAVLASAAAVAPESRLGRLVTLDGVTVGSRRVAQAFTRPEYVWPRPSAVGYAADATGGSNLSPANPAIRQRAEEILANLGATPEQPAPAELVLASGSGIDPHITEAAALYQADRIGAARDVPPETVREIIGSMAEPVGLGDPAKIVNVLLLNIELDRRCPTPPAPDGGQ